MPSAFAKTQVLTQWNTVGLNSAITRGFKASVGVAAADAKAHAPNSKSGVSSRLMSDVSAIIRPTGLGTIFEVGRQGGYPIFPTGVSGLRRSGRGANATYKVRSTRGGLQRQYLGGPGLMHPLADTLGGPMTAKPYVRPAGTRWANGGCQATMRTSMLVNGFK